MTGMAAMVVTMVSSLIANNMWFSCVKYGGYETRLNVPATLPVPPTCTELGDGLNLRLIPTLISSLAGGAGGGGGGGGATGSGYSLAANWASSWSMLTPPRMGFPSIVIWPLNW